MGTGTGRENLRCKVAELVFRDLQGAERGKGKVVGDEVREEKSQVTQGLEGQSEDFGLYSETERH